ncbi:hypothetical protein [Niallia circulans]|uniref:hypothetical protein n=1 Tax=Niallia circulans TaxID=1397 RepID=UPI0015CA3839|nr:hypothetical protein [Niallia circulans]
MEQVFTIAELVKKYGSEAIKRSFEKNGNLSGKELSTLKKSVIQVWESCELIEGRGSKRIFSCCGKRKKKVERVDKRVHNGQGQLVGEYELNSLVVNYLIQNENKVKPMSVTRWLTELGIVDGKLIGAIYGDRVFHLEELQKQFSSVIKDYNKADNDMEMVEEFLRSYLKHIKGSIVSVFKKLAKANVIIHQIEKWGCTSKNNHRKLKGSEVRGIADIRRTLLNTNGLKGRDLYKTNMKEVKNFKKDFDKQLQDHLGLKFYYDAHFCLVQDSDLGVRDYLDRLREKGELDFTYSLTEELAFTMTQMYKDMHSKHSLELAKCREKNTSNTSDSNRVKCLKIMMQYAPMWELLLRYFKCTSSLKSQPSVLEESVSRSEIEILELNLRSF